MSTKKVMSKDDRREAAVKLGLSFAKKVGAKRVSIAQVAHKQGVSAPLLFHIFESHEAFVKAILKAAKVEGVVLPDPAPTVRELRAMNKKATAKRVKKIAPPKPKKIAALRSALEVLAADTIDKSRAKLLKQKAAPKPVAPAGRKPLTAAQKQAKAERDRARRAKVSAPVPSTPAAKFAALPKPFEAALQQAAA